MTILTHRLARPIVLLACLLPLALLANRWYHNDLGINRFETLARYTGDWTLRFLLLTLAVTPLRRLPGLANLIRFRKLLGLVAFLHGSVHLFFYLSLDKQWIWEIILEDFRLRRFYIMGLLAYLCMLPLALTSTQAAIRWMGARRWRRLHRLIYISAAAGVLHFHWQGKALLLDPLVYAAILALLLGYRLAYFAWRRLRPA